MKTIQMKRWTSRRNSDYLETGLWSTLGCIGVDNEFYPIKCYYDWDLSQELRDRWINKHPTFLVLDEYNQVIGYTSAEESE